MMDQASLHHLRHDDRKQLDALLTTVNGAMNSVRRDECGDWTITGSRGTIRACNGKFYIYVPSGSALAWTWAKKKLAGFATVSQYGDDEGVLVFSKMPDADEAETLRSYIGLRQTRDVPPDQIQKARDAVTKGSIGRSMRYSGLEALDLQGGAQAANSGELSGSDGELAS